jgi:hypothetical protein
MYIIFDTIEEAQQFLSESIETAPDPNISEIMTRSISAIGNWADLPEGCISVKRCLFSTNMSIDGFRENYAIQNPNATYYTLDYVGNKGEQTDDFITDI